jgi:hypothetical protein
MSEIVSKLACRIRDETVELTRIAERVGRAWKSANRSGDDLYLDSVALNIHGFYDGLESILLKIAYLIDGTVPSGANWHELLLQEMSKEIEGVRPAVFSRAFCDKMDAYRGFRHVVRHVYAYKFNPDKLKVLVDNLPDTLRMACDELLAFADFLEQVTVNE